MEKDKLLNKWLNEGLSESEMAEFRKRKDYQQIISITEYAHKFKASNFSEVSDFQEFLERLEDHEKKSEKSSWLKPLMRIAAVFLLGVGLFYFLFSDQEVQIRTLAGEKTTIELPDASTVVVNALSEMSFDRGEWKAKRLVNLKGEAFFDVASGSTFDVNTPSGTVTVLGTEFNVKQREGFFEVQCFEGSVQVITEIHSEVLEAGENFRLTTGSFETGINKYGEPQWTKDLSTFQRVPLMEVVAELERQYGVDITLRNVKSNILFTGAFVHGDLDVALRSVTEPLDLQFSFESENQVSIYPREN